MANGLGAGVSGGTGATGALPKKPCYFFNHGGCKHADGECKFAHVHVSADDKAKMEKPQRGGSPTRSPRRAPEGNAQRPAENNKMHCFKFLKGTCTNGDSCVFAHIDAATVKEMERANKAKAKAKTQPKAKAKAAVVKSGTMFPVRSEE